MPECNEVVTDECRSIAKCSLSGFHSLHAPAIELYLTRPARSFRQRGHWKVVSEQDLYGK